jgi:site-specific DNA recombinase
MNAQTFFIYARKSTESEDRQIRSIGDQIAELRELATRESLSIADTFVEKQSAKIPGRPIFNEMVARIEAGEATGILAWHPDRLARNSLDGGRIIYLVDTGKITGLKFPTFVFDPSPSGKFMLSIMFGQSKYYVDALSENIRRGLRQKLKNGIWPGMLPVGYCRDKTTKEIKPDPQRAPLVCKAFELYATGEYTLDQITETINGLGLTNRTGEPLSRTQYHRLLQNPMYYGVFEYLKERHEGTHEPIIAKATFDKGQDARRQKSKPKTPTLKSYLYRGFLRCGECGCLITTETQKGHNYLRCTKRVKRDCSQKYLREEKLSEQLGRYIARLSVPAESADWMLAELEQEKASDTAAASVVIGAIRLHIKSVDEQLDRLMDAYLDKTLSLDEYRTAKNNLIEKKKQKEGELADQERHRSGWFEPATGFIKAAKYAATLASSNNDAEKLTFAKTTGSNFRLVNRELICDPRDAWKLVVDQGSFVQHNAASPCGDAAFIGETHLESQMRRGGDSNPRCGLSRIQHFQCCSFSHSDTSPKSRPKPQVPKAIIFG